MVPGMAADSAAAAAAAPPSAITSPFLLVSLNPDGVSLTRPPDLLLPPSSTGPVVSRDVTVDSAAGTWLRVYRPHQQPPEQGRPPLPVVVYHHGGGFILFSAASAPYHAFCESLAAALPAVVVSVEYRIAPEHRLPAAYGDAVSALHWLRGQAAAAGRGEEEEELLRGADYSRCFLMGSSSGANIVYHAGRRVAAESDGLQPLQLAGHVYIQPYFGGVGRTASELAMEDDAVLPLRAADAMWGLALPEGADRDHDFCNPASSATELKRAVAAGLPRSLVRGSTGDPLIDRQRGFVAMLRAGGVDVVGRLDGGGCHAAELFDPEEAERLFDDVRAFVYSVGARQRTIIN